jgi:hypothetical protein
MKITPWKGLPMRNKAMPLTGQIVTDELSALRQLAGLHMMSMHHVSSYYGVNEAATS